MPSSLFDTRAICSTATGWYITPASASKAAKGGELIAADATSKATTAAVSVVQAAIKAAVDPVHAEFDAFKRNAYLKEHGHRVSEGVQRVLATMSYATVKAILDGAPEPVAAGARTSAVTRGATKGTGASQLPTEDELVLARAFGTGKPDPIVERRGNALIFRPATPAQCRAHIAARAAGKAA